MPIRSEGLVGGQHQIVVVGDPVDVAQPRRAVVLHGTVSDKYFIMKHSCAAAQ